MPARKIWVEWGEIVVSAAKTHVGCSCTGYFWGDGQRTRVDQKRHTFWSPVVSNSVLAFKASLPSPLLRRSPMVSSVMSASCSMQSHVTATSSIVSKMSRG